MEFNYPLPSEFPNCRIFTGGFSGTDRGTFQIEIPEGARWLHFMLCGAGGNGGNGFTRAAGNTGRGGGGGGSGAMSLGFAVNSIFFPSVLFANLVGAGSTYYSSLGMKSNLEGDTVVSSGYSQTLLVAPAGSPGTAGSSASGGTGGNGGGGLGGGANSLLTMWKVLDGTDGGAGGTQTGAIGVSPPTRTGCFLTGGAGGAGCQTLDFAGGSVTGVGPIPTVLGGQAAGERGGGGFTAFGPQGVLHTGAGGGASHNSGTAGIGGSGAPGCGGGGGGAGTTGGTGGTGGRAFLMFAWEP